MLKKLQSTWPAAATLTVIILALSLSLSHFSERWITPPTVEAQGAGSANVTRTFSLPASASAQYIPACTTSGTNCIPNYKQVSQSAGITMASPSACGVLIDASFDDVNFQTIGANSQGGLTPTGTLYTIIAQANGNYPYVRLKIPACSVATTITYFGYGASQPITVNGSPFYTGVTSYASTGLGYLTPTVLQNVQCTNPDTNTAWLWITANGASGRSGLTDIILLEIPIAPGATYYYNGPPICLLCSNQSTTKNYLYFQATTTSAGTTPVSVPVWCGFESNGSGPYYPYAPVSP